MFRWIGIAVVLLVLYVGYPALKRLYNGEETGKETVHEIRDGVAKKIEN